MGFLGLNDVGLVSLRRKSGSTFLKNLALSHLGSSDNLVFNMSERIKKSSLSKTVVICLHSSSAPPVT